MFDYLGALGLALILCGWLYELMGSLKNKKAQVPLSFALLYGAGSALLSYHSLLLGDAIFLALNAAATLVAILNIALNLASAKPKQSASGDLAA